MVAIFQQPQGPQLTGNHRTSIKEIFVLYEDQDYVAGRRELSELSAVVDRFSEPTEQSWKEKN